MLRVSLVLGIWYLGFCALVEGMNCRRVHVGCRGNRARTAIAHIREKEGFAADKNIEDSSVIEIPAAASTRRSLIFWILNLGASLGFGAWSLGFRGCLMASSHCKRIEKGFGVIPIARAVFHPGDRVRISL